MASRWTDEELAYLRAHPEMTSAEIAEAIGRTARAVREMRYRRGRFQAHADAICVLCDERVVWLESAAARRLRLCKGCYHREIKMREAEDAEANRIRQARHKSKASANPKGKREADVDRQGKVPRV